MALETTMLLKLLWLKTLTGGKVAGPHFKHVLASPRLFAAELRFRTVNLATRLLSVQASLRPDDRR